MRSSFSIGVAAIALAFGVMSAADGAVIVLPLSAAGQATTPNTDGTGFTVTAAGGNPIHTQYNNPPGGGIGERQAIFEFSLAGLPAGAVIQSAEFSFNIALTSQTSGGPTTLYGNFTLFGYGGNNAVTVADVGSDGKLNVAPAYTAQFLGPDSIMLDVADIQTIVNQGPAALGLVGLAGSSLMTGIYTGSPNAPFLTLTYVPEPGALSLAGIAGLGLLARRRRR